MSDSKSKEIFVFSDDWDENLKKAQALASSSFVPKAYWNRPYDILVAVQMGFEVGLKTMQAIKGIAVINGIPSMYGDAFIAVVRDSPLCEYIIETFDDNLKMATCTAKRTTQEEPHTMTFSLSDAKQAGLTDKNVWQSYPPRMLQMRARGFCLRDLFPDVLKGMALGEEMEDLQKVQEAKQVNDAPQKSSKASKVSSFINDPIDSEVVDVQAVETVNQETGEVADYSAKIDKCESIEELVTLKAVLLQVPKGDYLTKLQREFNAKGRALYLETEQ